MDQHDHPTTGRDLAAAEGAPEVEVRLFAAAAAALGTERTTAHGRTVAEVLADLGVRTDDDGRRVLARCSVLVDTLACRDQHAPLAPGARLDVLPPFAGG